MAGGAFASLMATASQSQSHDAQKLARLKALQRSETQRRKERDLTEKERNKKERWERVREDREKGVAVRQEPETSKPAEPVKPKVVQPQRSMTFKKLLKEAAKVDPSTFKLGPKVKIQPRLPEKMKSSGSEPKRPISVKSASPIPSGSPVHPASSVKPTPRPQKSVVERTQPPSSRSVSPKKPQATVATKSPLKYNAASKPSRPGVAITTKKDTKSRLQESISNGHNSPARIPVDPKRKQSKNYPSETRTVARKRELDEESEDSFIASDDEMDYDYRSEIRSMFHRRGGGSKVDFESDDSDMEATGLEMAAEEARAEKLARMEDEEEVRKEEEHIREKKKRKLLLKRKLQGK